MLNEEEYSSDTSDEDFIPTGVESDDEDIDQTDDKLCSDSNSDEEAVQHTKRKGSNRNAKPKKKKQKKCNPLLASLQTECPMNDEKRDTMIVNESKNKDSLWADFLADVEEKKPETPKSTSKLSWSALLGTKKKPTTDSQNQGQIEKKPASIPPVTKDPAESKPNTVKVTKIFEFAGEEVRVEEELTADNIQTKNSLSSAKNTGSGGPERSKLQDLVGMIGNKKKLSTLEKTKLDWNNFKTTEGLKDELQSHLKSKDGYLEKKEFLERANIREYEIERDLKMQRRSNR